MLFLCITFFVKEMRRMAKIMKAQEVRVLKAMRIKQETVDAIEMLQKKEGISQGKIIDLAIELLRKQKELA